MGTSSPHGHKGRRAQWKVTGQTEEPTFLPNGDKTTMHHVTFETNDGATSHVSLADEHFSAENVAAQIHHKASTMDEVGNMTSETHPPEQ